MTVAVLAIFIFGLSAICPVLAGSGVDNAIGGLKKSGSWAYDNADGTSDPKSVATDLPSAIGKVVGAILAFIGVLFLILIIYGGFTWMVARGNESEVTRAKDMIQAAVIGLVIVLAAYAITTYVGSIISG